MTGKVVRVTAHPREIPLKPGLESSSAAYATPGRAYRCAVVEVELDDGTIGIAEAPVRPYVYGDTLTSLTWMVNEVLGPRIVGRDPRDVTRIRAEMDVPTGVVDNLVAKGAIDVALHDVLARAAGVALYELLGGYSPVARPVVATTWILPLHEPEAVLAECERAVGLGFASFKVKVGRREVAVDIDLVRALRGAVGAGITLYADANGAYGARDAVRFAAAVAESDVAWLEDPCPGDLPLATRREVRSRSAVPIVGDATCFTPRDVLRELSHELVDLPMVKLPRTGYLGARAIVEVCRAFGVPCLLGTQGEADLGTIAAGHLAVAFPDTVVATTELSFFERMAWPLTDAGLAMERGGFVLPPGPGIGAGLRPTDSSSSPGIR